MLDMVEQRLTEEHFEREIDFDPQIIAQVLKSCAKRPSAKMVEELKELSVDITKENIWEIFLFDSLRKVEGHLILYPDKKEVTFHTRVHAEVSPIVKRDLGQIEGRPAVTFDVDEKASPVIKDLGLGFLKLTGVTNIYAAPAFGRVQFENPVARLDVYHDCQHNFVTKST